VIPELLVRLLAMLAHRCQLLARAQLPELEAAIPGLADIVVAEASEHSVLDCLGRRRKHHGCEGDGGDEAGHR